MGCFEHIETLPELQIQPSRIRHLQVLNTAFLWDLVTWFIIRATILMTPTQVFITLLTKSYDPPK